MAQVLEVKEIQEENRLDKQSEDASFPHRVSEFFREIFFTLLRIIWATLKLLFSRILAVNMLILRKIEAVFCYSWKKVYAAFEFLLRGFHFWCTKNKAKLSLAAVSFLLGYGFYFGIKYQEYIQETAFKYFVGATNSTNKNLFDLGFPETSAYTQHLVVLYDLADTLRQSHEVQQNGLLISGCLNGLAEDIKVAEEDINDFRRKSSEAIINLQFKMSLIYDVLDADKSSDEDENFYFYDTYIPDLLVDQFYKMFTYWNDQNFSGFIQRQLKFLELVFRDFKGQLNKMISSLSKVKLDARNLSFYLLDAEREAERAIKNYWAERFIDYGKIIRAEKELIQVRQMKKFIKSLVANLNEFDHYLRDYQRKLFDVETDIVYTRALKKPSKVLLNYLKTSANQFQKTHRLFDTIEKKIGAGQSTSLKNATALEYEELYETNNHQSKLRTLIPQQKINASLSYIPPYPDLIY
ncbi:13209_t:CDS:2 [Ambispora leptoticha]|uniref:13209_t:CDS:1 n=1 Tax=Ambispora leptoticha TaxID=144679 RepID=A0A9N9AL77_9GLOM|nr:13209_t:CDS:2 [Ambispora leptoticha]